MDRERNTALHLACLNGQDDVMDELLSVGEVILNAPNNIGFTPLHFAASSSSGTACLEALVAYQGNAIDIDDYASSSAADFNAPKLLVNCRDQFGRTPLHMAAKFGRNVRVQELLRVGAEANASDRWMMTPLHYAVRSGQTQVIETLLSQPDVDANVMDDAGMTALHHAAYYGLSSTVGTLLKSWTCGDTLKTANPVIHDITGRFPHFLAAYSGNVDCLRLLFPAKYGYLITSLDNFERSPLHYAGTCILLYDVHLAEAIFLLCAAACENDFQCLQYLLELRKPKEKDLNASNDNSNRVDDPSDEPLFNVNQSDIFGRTVSRLIAHQ